MQRAFTWVLLLIAALLIQVKSTSTDERTIWSLTVDGVITPTTARYFERELKSANEAGAHAVILRLNTPGGLERSMRVFTRSMLQSEIPVIVHVAPRGARAASAGMFITIAAHVAVMSPGTNIGAAHPVAIGQSTPAEGEKPSVMETKVVQDAAALARSIAQDRNRNASWAEQAVTESVSITAREAVRMNVIDFIAADQRALLERLNGRQVKTAQGTVTLNTRNARILEKSMSFPERILQVITDPNIAYLLMTLGIIGIIAELYSPGLLFPGVLGAISLILAFVAMGSLPFSLAGVLLLAGGVVMLLLDLISEGFGFLGIAGVAAFVLGSFLLYTPISPVSPSMPEVQVSRWLIFVMLALVLGTFLLVGRAILRARREPIATGVEALVGHIGVAITDLNPRGLVQLNSETWNAVTDGMHIKTGESVEVKEVHGVTLKVEMKRHAA